MIDFKELHKTHKCIAGAKIHIKYIDKDNVGRRVKPILSVSLNDSEFVSFDRIEKLVKRFLDNEFKQNYPAYSP